MAEQTQRQVVRFGVFEASLRAGELRKHGLLIRVPGQPFKILAILLAGEAMIVRTRPANAGHYKVTHFKLLNRGADFDHFSKRLVSKDKVIRGFRRRPIVEIANLTIRSANPHPPDADQRLTRSWF